MSKKRFRKLARAYFTRLNEYAKENNLETMTMGQVYRVMAKLESPENMTRAEWWATLSQYDTFGVGVKVK